MNSMFPIEALSFLVVRGLWRLVHIKQLVLGETKISFPHLSYLTVLTVFEVLLAGQLLGVKALTFNNTFPYPSIFRAIFWFGLLLTAAGRLSLGDSWGPAGASVRKLVTKGVYQYWRHPIYLGLFLTWGAASILTSSFLIIITLGYVPIWFYITIRKEEKELTQKYPQEFKRYQAKTKLLIPGLF